MALKIRLRQQGRKNRQTFRLVVTDIRNPRDGKYLETLGSYDPQRPQSSFQLNADRLSYWLGKGAELSETAEKLVKTVAPAVIKGLKEKQNAARVKQAAVRRNAKKKAPKAAAPAKPAKKAAAPVAKEETAEEAPKKRRAPAKKAKKDES
jgi:small subunit ribosomal protein S16